MALDDIITSPGQSPVLAINRGDIGSAVDIVSNGTNEFVVPAIEAGEGGGGFISIINE